MDLTQGLRAAMAAVDDYYRDPGIFQGRFGFGQTPALVVIDMAYGWTDPAYAGGSARLDAAVDAICQLLPVGRAKGVPVFYTTSPFRAGVQASFFARHLKDKGEKPPEALLFQTGSNRWVRHERWPPKAAVTRTLYFHPNGRLVFAPPAVTRSRFDEYLSDPARPVPYRPRPVTPTYPGREWQEWMVEDQRFTQHRPDVLTYETDPLEADVTVAGSLTAHLFAATSGTDCDWVVRLIDVYPEQVAKDPGLGGFQLLVSGEPMRARFRKSLEKPEPVVPGEVNEYTIDLHWSHHCFRKGHKIMVQVQHLVPPDRPEPADIRPQHL
jgi:putative CocE/NonD family hydrolase